MRKDEIGVRADCSLGIKSSGRDLGKCLEGTEGDVSMPLTVSGKSKDEGIRSENR